MKKLIVLAALIVLAVPAVGTSATAERGSKAIGAYSNYFSPSKVTVSAGTKVTWRVRQGVHNVKGRGFASPILTKGRSYSKKFKRRGTFGYVCTLHAGMGGKVVVR